ncbi:hypothetical protein KY284_007255 [Solanum tuberosum]|nr:hypothetical protein KY284_007255 [Solanum tuberosum]
MISTQRNQIRKYLTINFPKAKSDRHSHFRVPATVPTSEFWRPASTISSTQQPPVDQQAAAAQQRPVSTSRQQHAAQQRPAVSRPFHFPHSQAPLN